MRQTIFTILFVIVILATSFVWYRYIRQPGGVTTTPSDFAATDERLNQYRQLKSLKLDSSVLSDPLFQSLVGASPANASGTSSTGRTNPFAPF